MITLIPRDHLIVSAKGDVKYAISPTDILAVVQNKSTPRFFSIYLKTSIPPLHFETLDEASSAFICACIANFISGIPLSFAPSSFQLIFESDAEKQGKHQWASRHLRIYGKRLFILRDTTSCSFLSLHSRVYPINVIDISHILVELLSPNSLCLVTHRRVCFSFPHIEYSTHFGLKQWS